MERRATRGKRLAGRLNQTPGPSGPGLLLEFKMPINDMKLADLAGALGLDLGGAIAEKMAFNATRPDHKPENRKLENGKKY